MPRTGAILLLAAITALAGPGRAMELDLPGQPVLAAEVIRNPDSYMLPDGPWADGGISTIKVTGRVLQQAWRVQAPGVTTAQIMAPLREQVRSLGFEILLDCAGRECGGFDFRFETRVLPAPDMFVDLFDYRFLSARQVGEEDTEALSILVSRSAGTGYVQLIQVTPAGREPLQILPEERPRADSGGGMDDDTTLAERLERQGHVILHDLEFGSGAAELGSGPFPSLAALARYLRANPSRRVALVGHTDSIGALDGNIALSRRRAAAVLARLVEVHEIPAEQLESGGMGYLAPVAPNLSAQGRETNRRVEAVLLNTE